ncbi:hypothetical protein niasHS_013792 [Heterodera schachtii]|uniref:Secreted protein n=1 Tax=Heterodera schachtii TaxID=97005 RepID=A0ABD2IQL3_HETSC
MKARRISLIQLQILLLKLIGGIVSTDQQREVNGTTEGEAAEEAKDMALALSMSRRQFWHQMTDEWNCKNGKLQKPKEEMFSKGSYHNFGEFCESWKTKAISVSLFVKSWQCKKGGKSGDGTTDETPTKNDGNGKRTFW